MAHGRPLVLRGGHPCVVILGISKSGFGSGLGSIAVPLMAMVVSVPAAAAILMPVLLVLDLLSIHAFRRL
jgi:uncharacterized membrane protein YfcA